MRFLRRNRNKDQIKIFEDIKNNPTQLIKGINAILEHEGEQSITSSFLWKPLITLPEKLDETFIDQNKRNIN